MVIYLRTIYQLIMNYEIIMTERQTSTCNNCGITKENSLKGTLPVWWVRTKNIDSFGNVRILCQSCATKRITH